MSRRSLTLIELIAIIVVIGLTIPPILNALNNATIKVAQAEFTTTTAIVGRDLLEEIISKRFDEVDEAPWTPSDEFGTGRVDEADETSRDEYDDVDDFDDLVETNISGFPGFSRSTSVYYVDPDGSDLDTEQAAATNYKRVDVTVTHDLLGDMNFSFIISSEY